MIVSVKSITNQMTPLSYSSEILAAKNLDELSAVIDRMKADGNTINISLEKAKAEIGKNADTLAKNEKFIAIIKNKKGEKQVSEQVQKTDEKKPDPDEQKSKDDTKEKQVVAPDSDQEKKKPEVQAATQQDTTSDDSSQIRKLAEDAVFNAAKEKLNLQIIGQIKSAIPLIESAIKDMKIDSDTLQLMKKDTESVVKRSAEVYEELLKSYKKIKDDLQKVF